MSSVKLTSNLLFCELLDVVDKMREKVFPSDKASKVSELLSLPVQVFIEYWNFLAFHFYKYLFFILCISLHLMWPLFSSIDI